MELPFTEIEKTMGRFWQSWEELSLCQLHLSSLLDSPGNVSSMQQVLKSGSQRRGQEIYIWEN